MPEGHPYCDPEEDGDNVVRRCGFEEIDARGYCGMNCTSSSECGEAEYCYPVQRNFCLCFEEQDAEAAASPGRRAQETPQTNEEYFDEAREVIEDYFLEAAAATDPPTDPPADPPANAPVPVTPAPADNNPTPPTSAGSVSQQSVVVSLLVAGAVFVF